MTRLKSMIAFALVAPICAAETDPFAGQLVSPDVIVRYRDDISLAEQQLERIRKHMEKGTRDAADLQLSMTKANQQMAQLLWNETIDEAAVLAKLDEIMKIEQSLKKIHLRIMIRVRNELTNEQRAILAKKSSQGNPTEHDLEDRLKRKLTQIQRELERRVASGVPPMQAAKMMQEFQREMLAGRPEEAEATLDQVFKRLDLTKPANDTDEDSAQLASPPDFVTELAVPERLSATQLKREVKALRRSDVAWRKIHWETCLLEGLRRSRDEKKPIILWVFIDRPIDDERC